MRKLELSNATICRLDQISENLLKVNPIMELERVIKEEIEKCHGCYGACGTGFKLFSPGII